MAEGSIVTFYSYKGGVGRSFAMANVGVALASWGYRILCVDWDLEAPGLHKYLSVKEPTSGVVELISSLTTSRVEVWKDHVRQVSLANGARFDLLAAGGQDDKYIDRVQQLNWVKLYEENGLGEQLEQWRNAWKSEYDFVLIDSRTGITDIGALCTAHLPDILVVLFTANHQSIEGCLRVVQRADEARKFVPFDRPALMVLPVPSRFDAREEYERAKEWRGIFAEKTKELYESWADRGLKIEDLIARTTIPYVAYWSFGEGLPVIEETSKGTESIKFYFETLAGLIAHRLNNTTDLVTSAESYINSAKSSGHRTAGFAYHIFLSGTQDQMEKCRELEVELTAQGFKLYTGGNMDSEGADITEELDRAISQSQNAVFLMGRQHSHMLDIELRKFATQLLDDGTPRVILPISFGNYSQTVPSILHRSVVQIADGTSIAELARLIAHDIKADDHHGEPKQKFSSEVQLAISRLNDDDPLNRVAAVNVIGRVADFNAISKLFDRLADNDERVRNAAQAAILSMRPEVEAAGRDFLDLLRKQTHTDDINTRLSVAELLARLGDQQSYYGLVELLSHKDSRIREKTVLALGKVGNASVIDWLTPRLDDEDSRVRFAAASVLSGFLDPRAVKSLILALSKPESQNKEVFDALSECDNPALVPLVILFLDDPDLSEGVISALVALKDHSVGALTDQLQSPSSTVRITVARALGAIKDPNAVNALLGSLDDVDENVRHAAVVTLGQIRASRAIDPLLDILKGGNLKIQQAAVVALDQIGDRRAQDRLLTLLDEASDKNLIILTLHALGRLGDNVAFIFIAGYFSHKDIDIRTAAVTAAGKLGGEWLIPELAGRLSDQAEQVRSAAIEALAKMPQPSNALSELLTALQDDSPSLRKKTVEILLAIGDVTVADHLLELFDDPFEDVRITALVALATLLSFDSTDRRLISKDVDAREPWLDPKKPITQSHVTNAKEKLPLSIPQLRNRFEKINERLGSKLRLTWARKKESGTARKTASKSKAKPPSQSGNEEPPSE